MLVINNERLWLGIGSELVLLLALVFILTFIFTSGKLRGESFKKAPSKWPLWLAALLIVGSIVFVYLGTISSAVIQF